MTTMAEQQRELLTIGQVARRLKVSVRTVQRMIAQGRIKVVRVTTRKARVWSSDIESLR